MFGIGFDELLVIIIVAILFLGPDKLPEAMVKLGRFVKSVKKVMDEAKHSIESEMKIAELKEEALSYKKKLDEATNDLKNFKNVTPNPTKEINDAINYAKSDFNKQNSEQKESIEPKREVVTFPKKSKKESQE